jgi:sugar phosphate isomerase/epimerase
MPLPLAVQLYSLREEAQQDFPMVLKKVAAMGYKGVEFAGLYGHDPAEVARMVADLGMVCASAHMAVATPENINQIVDEAKALGIEYLCSGGGPDNFKDMDSIQEISARFATSAELLAEHGIRFGIHNHWWEFDHQVDGRCPHDIMMELSGDAFAQVDVCWAAFGGDDPVRVIESNTGRVDLLHIKDSMLDKNDQGRPASPHVAVGTGKVDIPGCVAAGEMAGSQWLIVELDSCATAMDQAVAQSALYMIQNGLADGNTPGCCCADGCCS